MYILDTSAVLEIVRGREPGKKVQDALGDNMAATTSFTHHEMLIGTNQREKQKLEQFFKCIEILPFGMMASTASADIYKRLQEAGSLINVIDILIAGICVSNGATLITLDRDFTKVRGLSCKLID